MLEDLQDRHIKVVFLIDGLEEIFEHTISSENEKNAIRALCRDLVEEVKIAYHNVGLMIFLRKDMARDIIRFLEKATDNVGKPVYEDRYLMPTEIRKAVSECSTDKIGEIRDEIKALGPIFDKLENAPEESKVLPFSNDTFNLTQTEEKIMKQEGYLKIDNDRYYLPEIIRHALKFKYEKGARPKVLSLLLK